MNDKLDRFLNNEMDPSERKVFQKEVSQDKKLRSTLQIHQAVDQTIGDSKELALEATLRSMRKAKPSAKTRSLRPVLAVAASLVLIVSAFFLIRSFNSESLLNGPGASLFEPGTMQETQLSSNSDKLLAAGQKAYNQGDYQTALADLKAYLEETPQHESARIFAAKAALISGDVNQALQYLAYFDRTESLYADQAAWLQAVCYAELNDNAKARTILQDLQDSSDPAFAEKAKKLLEKL